MHTVTIDDIILAMKNEIILASSCNAKTHRAKDLKFNPAQLRYKVRYYDGQSETSNSYLDPIIAIAKYNSYDA